MTSPGDGQLLLDLGPLGQTSNVHLYTVTCIGFTVESKSSIESAKATLGSAADSICEIYPWLKGQVICEPPSPTERSLGGGGTLKVITYPEHEGTGKFLRVKDCTNLCPKYADVLQSRAPAAMLDGRILSPAYGLPNTYPLDMPMPVILMQLNILDGGLILTTCAQHNVMDGNANAVFIRQFAGLCCGIKPSPDQIEAGNADRTTIIPPLLPTESPKTLTITLRSTKPEDKEKILWPPTWPAPDSPSPWKTFRISSASLGKLRDLAMRSFQPTPETPFLSTDDVLTAFLWTRFTAARFPTASSYTNHTAIKKTTTLFRAVNARARLSPPLSPSYMGFLIVFAGVTLPIDFATDAANYTGCISQMRATLLTDVTDLHVRSWFHKLKTSVPTSIARPGPTLDYGTTDFLLTSFMKQGLYELEFGSSPESGLGKPDFVRRPLLPDCRPVCYIMPRTRDGDVDVVWAMSETECEGLRADPMWKEYAEFLG